MATDSYLESRRAALVSGEASVPLDYDELRDRAAERMPSAAYDYAAGAAGTEETMRANRAAFRRYRILPRILRDVAERDLSIELFGRELAAPLLLAPIGGQLKYHGEGELATARAAGGLGIPMVLSTRASRSIEAVAEANGENPRLFQLYWPNDWAVARSFVERAEAAGYDGVVLTVDSKLSKWRRRNLRPGGAPSTPNAIFESDPVVRSRAAAAGEPLASFVRTDPSLDDDPSIDWDDLRELRGWTDLPLVLKGVLAPADAERALEAGVDGLVVSNHGGRQIDGEVTAIEQLPAVASVVDGAVPIVLDSGVRTGADAFKALALGADAVQIGRPYVFGLAVAGEQGVREVALNLLAELESVVGLSGRRSVEEIDREAITRTGPTAR